MVAVTFVALMLVWGMVMEDVVVENLMAAQSYLFCCCCLFVLTGEIYWSEELLLLPLFVFLLVMVVMVEPMVGFGSQFLNCFLTFYFLFQAASMVLSPLTPVYELVDSSNLVVEGVVEGAMSLLSYQRALLGV